MKRHEKMIIDYYNGAYGRTIRIGVQEREWIVLLRDLVLQLINDMINCVDLLQMENVQYTNLSELKLIKVSKSIYSNLLEISHKRMPPSFLWQQTKEELIVISELIEGLLCADMAGHQYLTTDDGDILIELTYKE